MKNMPRVWTSSSAQLFLPGELQWKACIKREKHSKNQADSFPHTLISTLPLSLDTKPNVLELKTSPLAE